MLAQAAAFGPQLRVAEPLARGALAGRGPFRNVLLAGLGGSAAGARLAVAMLERQLTLPVVVVAGRRLPAWVDDSTLVIATSYSGATVETLDWFEAALARGACAVAVTAGGDLVERAEATGAPVVRVEGGYQPRGALGLLLAPLLVLLHEAGAAPDPSAVIAAGAAAADAVMHRCGPETDGDDARRAAEALVGHPLVIYGAGMRGAVAVRLKNQVNENAKAVAFAGCLPEVAHNEVLGWTAAGATGRGASAGSVAVLLRDAAESREEAALADALAEVIGGDAASVEQWWGEGDDEIARAFSLLAFGDLVSCHLGLLLGRDLLDIGPLNLLKQRLADARRATAPPPADVAR